MLHLQAPQPNLSRALLADHAYATLHAAILRGELPPGTPMREAELARQLGISRTPVREALRRLFLEGFLTRLPNGSAVVGEATGQRITDAFDVRKLLEGHAVRRAAEVATAEDIAYLEELVNQAQAFVSAQAWERLSTLNDRFHGYIEMLAHNAVLTRTTQALREQIAAYRAFAPGTVEQQEGFVDEHRAIIMALASHDGYRAEALATEHLERALALLLVTYAGEPDDTAQRHSPLPE